MRKRNQKENNAFLGGVKAAAAAAATLELLGLIARKREKNSSFVYFLGSVPTCIKHTQSQVPWRASAGAVTSNLAGTSHLTKCH